MSELQSSKSQASAIHSFKTPNSCTAQGLTIDRLTEVIQNLQLIQDDATIPNHVRKSISETLKALQASGETSIRVSRARQALEEITDNETVEAYTRTQLLNIVSMLEQV